MQGSTSKNPPIKLISTSTASLRRGDRERRVHRTEVPPNIPPAPEASQAPPQSDRKGSLKGRSNKCTQFKHLLFKHLQKVCHAQTSTGERRGFKFKPTHLPSGPRELEHHTVSPAPRAVSVVALGSQGAWLAGQTRQTGGGGAVKNSVE